MKFSDIAPVLIENLPFHSLMRCSTEAGERPDYMNMMYYYSHTLCGGGKGRPDVLKKIFKWQWHTLWYCIMSGPQPIASAFKAWVAGRLSNKANEVHDDVAEATMENDEDGGVVRDSTPFTGCTSVLVGSRLMRCLKKTGNRHRNKNTDNIEYIGVCRHFVWQRFCTSAFVVILSWDCVKMHHEKQLLNSTTQGQCFILLSSASVATFCRSFSRLKNKKGKVFGNNRQL